MSFSAGNSGSPSYFPDGYNGSQLANIETISATRILTSSDRRIQILTPNGATRIVQLPSSTVLGEEWVFINPSTSSQSLTITSSNTATIITIVPGSTIRVNALVASPSAPSDWVLNSLGNTVGPGSAVDNAIVRFDGTTGKLVQNSGATIDDNGSVSFTNTAGETLVLKKSTGSSMRWQNDASVSGTANYSIDNNTGVMRFYNHGGTINGSISQAGEWTLGPSTTQVGTYSAFNGVKGMGSSYLGWGLLSGASATILAADSAGVLEFYSDSKANILSGSISGTKTASVTAAGAWILGPNSFSGVHNINGIVRVVVPGATTGGFRLSGATSESHLQFLGTNASTNGSLRFYSYRSDLSNELDVGFISGSGAWTLGNTGFGSATQQTIYGYGVSGANAVVLRNLATVSGGDILDLQTAATSGTVSAFTMTDGTGYLCGYCTIDTTANTVSYVNTSDVRLKHRFEDFNGLGLIAQMKPWQYERKTQEGKKEIGFVAQEMESVFPQAVTTANDEFQTMGIDYSKFTPVLVKAIQELKAELDVAKAQIQTLLNP